MSKELRIRNVSDQLHRRLVAAATSQGLPLEDYVLRALRQLGASQPPKRRASPKTLASRRTAFYEQAAMECLATLSEMEARVMEMRLGIGDAKPHTLQEIADLLDVSRQRVHQIEASALSKLSHPARLEVLGFAMRKLQFLSRQSR